MQIISILAHAGEEAAESPAASGFWDSVAHQSAPAAMVFVLFVLIAVYGILGIFKVKVLSRLLMLLPVIIGLAIFFMEHNPTVAAITLSGGFILVFFLVLTMLGAPKK
jgi:hypothetical protein